MMSYTFSEGDKVKVVRRGSHDNPVGTVFTIMHVDTDANGTQPYQDDEGTWYYENEIELLDERKETADTLKVSLDLSKHENEVKIGQVRTDGQGCVILVIAPIEALSKGDFNSVVLVDPYTDGSIEYQLNGVTRNQSATGIIEEFPILLDAELTAKAV